MFQKLSERGGSRDPFRNKDRMSFLHCRPIEKRRRDVERRLGLGRGRGQRWRAEEVWRGRAEPRPRAHAQDDGGDGVRLHLLLDALLGHYHVVSWEPFFSRY